MSNEVEFESKAILKCFWCRNVVISLLLNLIGGCYKLFELVFGEKITSLACLVGPGLNCITTDKPNNLSFQGCY